MLWLYKIIWKKGKDEIAENAEKIIFSFGGDSRPINPQAVKNTLFLCHEATYMAKEDDERDFQQHSFLEEVLENAREANAETLLLMHTSLRYNLEEIFEKITEAKQKLGINYKIILLYGDYFFDTDVPLSRRNKNKHKNSNIE